MAIQTDSCPQCGDENRLRKRDFSDQAWSALVVWGEVSKKAVGHAICDSCYGDLREILIERADEYELSLTAKKTTPKKTTRKQVA